ncbi:hypothetical protein C1645_790448 [Glomus cerebriforme]|uniref:SAM domain-containing protein n=1 Tax=Glomus cerebriforme TaxID=658196 RepID=A0A397SBR2_9GLOM|nr:hypothetical protein C1645_790448 [Glomus cerebriforme]
MTTISNVKKLSTEELANFLEENLKMLTEKTDVLKSNKIDGEILLSMTEKELRELGMLFGTARKIILFIRELGEKEYCSGT